MRTFLGISMIFVYVFSGLLLSINLGISHGAKGYFVGALLGFGGSVAIGAVVISIFSKWIRKK